MRDLSPKNLEGIDEPAALKACDDAPLPQHCLRNVEGPRPGIDDVSRRDPG